MKNRIKIRQHKKTPPPATQPNTASVAYKSAEPFGQKETVQRQVSESVHADDEKKADAVTFENALDASVQKAHHHVISAPQLGPVANLDGHTAKWVDDWNEYNNGNDKGTLPRALGYAIESLATMVYKPEVPAGLSSHLQGVRGNTRPDVILTEQNHGDVSWLDITASSSAGHIWSKDGWDQQDHVSEITYPSLEDAHRQEMKKNHAVENPPDFDPELFQAELQQAKLLHSYREQHWKTIGRAVRKAFLARPEKPSNEVANLNPKLHKQNPLMQILKETLNLDIELDEPFRLRRDTEHVHILRERAPHILAALGLGGSLFGFIGGGAKAGQSWLQENDPHLPQITDMENDIEFMERITAEPVPDDGSKKKRKQDTHKDRKNVKKRRLQ